SIRSPSHRRSIQVSSCSLFCRGSRLSSRTAATRASLDCCSSSVGYSSTRASTFKSCIVASSVLQLLRVNLLHGRQFADHAGGLLLAAEQAEVAVTTVAAVAEAEATTATLAVSGRIREGFLGQLTMAGRNHKAVLVVGDSEVAVHFVRLDRKSTRLNSSHVKISYAAFCWQEKTQRFAFLQRGHFDDQCGRPVGIGRRAGVTAGQRGRLETRGHGDEGGHVGPGHDLASAAK